MNIRVMRKKTIRVLLPTLLLLLWALPTHAVLKEKDLEQTLTILREEITSYYHDLQSEAKSHKQYRDQVIMELVEIARRSNQNALMLYSQKNEYVFDLTYACNEVTQLFKDYHRKIQPFRTSIENIDTEIARYDSLKTSLDKMSVRTLSEQAKVDRNVCLTLAVCIDRMLRENRQSMSDYIDIYKRTEERLERMNDYANKRYNEIQNNIFINGGENYLSILSHFRTRFHKTKDTVIEKYEPTTKTVKSQWDSRMIVGLFITMGIFALAAMAISFLGTRVVRKRLGSDSLGNKRTAIIMTATVLIFALALQFIRITWEQNFFIMASGLLTQYAWLLGVILVSLLLRVSSEQIMSAPRIYAPLIAIGFIVIAFRIILVPNELVNLILPPILLGCAIWQWWVVSRHNHNIPQSDMFYSYISAVVFIISVVCSWIGYTLLSVQLLIWWVMQLTCILTITCLRSWIKNYGKRHNFEEKPITQSWHYDLLYSVLLPSLGVMSVLLAVYWAASVFSLTEITWRIFTYKFIESPSIHQRAQHRLGGHPLDGLLLPQPHGEGPSEALSRASRPHVGREPLCHGQEHHPAARMGHVAHHQPRHLQCGQHLDCGGFRRPVHRRGLCIERHPGKHLLRHLAHGRAHQGGRLDHLRRHQGKGELHQLHQHDARID